MKHSGGRNERLQAALHNPTRNTFKKASIKDERGTCRGDAASHAVVVLLVFLAREEEKKKPFISNGMCKSTRASANEGDGLPTFNANAQGKFKTPF